MRPYEGSSASTRSTATTAWTRPPSLQSPNGSTRRDRATFPRGSRARRSCRTTVRSAPRSVRRPRGRDARPEHVTGVATVGGVVPSADLGITLVHEHVLNGAPGIWHSWPELLGGQARFLYDAAHRLA